MNTKATSQQEIQAINEALQNIIGLLHTSVEASGAITASHPGGKVSGILSSDTYREESLAMVLNRGAFWSWGLLAMPLDDDFIYLAYRIILGREPDQEGFGHFQSALSVCTISRVSVLRALLLSHEVRDRNPPITGKRQVTFLYEVGRFFGKIPLVNRVIRAVWMMSTGQKRTRRIALLLQGFREELQEVREELVEHRLRSDDTIEYFSNLNRCNLWSASLDRMVAKGKQSS